MNSKAYKVHADAGRALTKEELSNSLLKEAEKARPGNAQIIPGWFIEFSANEHADKVWFMWQAYNHQLALEKAIKTRDFDFISDYLENHSELLNDDASDYGAKHIPPEVGAFSAIKEYIIQNKLPDYMTAKGLESILGELSDPESVFNKNLMGNNEKT